MTLKIQKRGIWGGYSIEMVGPKHRGYFWFGEGNKYLMALTLTQAKQLAKFIARASK